MAKVEKNTLINDLLLIDPEINIILLSSGMHCIGCAASAGETLEEACIVHGLDADEMIEKINKFLADKVQ